MPPIGIGNLQSKYKVGAITWTKVERNAIAANVDYDPERTAHPVFQYNRNGNGKTHLSIHSGFAGVITNVHYTNGSFNNAKIHYNVAKSAKDAGFSVDWAQVGAGGKKGFSESMSTMQAELIAFLVQSQIDPTAQGNTQLKDSKYQEAEAFKNKPVEWGEGKKTKRGTTFTLYG
jgi:hypothetical protein